MVYKIRLKRTTNIFYTNQPVKVYLNDTYCGELSDNTTLELTSESKDIELRFDYIDSMYVHMSLNQITNLTVYWSWIIGRLSVIDHDHTILSIKHKSRPYVYMFFILVLIIATALLLLNRFLYKIF